MKTHPVLLAITILAVACLTLNDAHAQEFLKFSDNWVATDALGRTLPQHAEAGDRKSEKFVGVFYFVWVGNHSQQVYDISKILQQQDESKRKWGA